MADNKKIVPIDFKSLGNSIKKVVDNAISGNDLLVNEQIKEKRLIICKTCPFYKKPLGQCEKCGCFCNFKVTLKTEECPEGKWKQET